MGWKRAVAPSATAELSKKFTKRTFPNSSAAGVDARHMGKIRNSSPLWFTSLLAANTLDASSLVLPLNTLGVIGPSKGVNGHPINAQLGSRYGQLGWRAIL
jgi:hypothetical protein